jgi:AbrB family looped-hinge helix DNA binding protein
MAIARSKLTAQGQISVPAEVRRKLGIGPGSVLEWDEQEDQIVVRRSGQYSSADVHAALFPADDSRPTTAADIKQGIRKAVRRRHARR